MGAIHVYTVTVPDHMQISESAMLLAVMRALGCQAHATDIEHPVHGQGVRYRDHHDFSVTYDGTGSGES